MIRRFGRTGGFLSAARFTGWLFLACGLVLAAHGASVTATVDRPTIALGETVTLTLSFDGGNVSQPALPAIPNFQIVGQSSAFSMDVTRGISQQTYSFQLAPAQAGDFTIPGFQLSAGGQVLRTQPLQIKVLQAGGTVTAPGATAPSSFVKLITPKTQLYVGEVSEVQVQVYFQEGRLTQYPPLPTDSGFTVGKWLKPTESRVNISNQLYVVVTFKEPITPVKAGLLTLGPATVSLLVPDKTRRPDFFGGRPEREMRMATEKMVIQVLPIPEQNAPPTFAGAVGNFTLALTATPTTVAVGDPITVRVKISGSGALDAVRLPPQPDWNEFKMYPPTSQLEATDPNNNSGTKNFEQVVVPERAGIKMLPPLAFSFFDPEQKAFRTLTSMAIPLNVSVASGGGAALPSLPGASNAAPAQPASDLAHIKPELGIVTTGSLLMTRPWFLGAQFVPPAIWLGLLAWRKYRERLENDPKLRRRNEVAQKVRSGLAELREHTAAKNSDAFFSTLSRLLQEQIAERVDAPANSITEAVVEERLRPLGAHRELCIAVQSLFQRCNLARYAPLKSSEELSALIPQLEKALSELQQWEPGKS